MAVLFLIQNKTEVFFILYADFSFAILGVRSNIIAPNIVTKEGKTMATAIVNVSLKVNSSIHNKIQLPEFWDSAFHNTVLNL